MLVAAGAPAQLMAEPRSKTGRYLRAAAGGDAVRPPRVLPPGVTLRGVTIHNVRNLDVEIPAGGLIAITGVSGSGKSSLVFDALAPAVSGALERGGTPATAAAVRECVVGAGIRRVIDVQSAGTVSSPWSTVATDSGVFDHVRDRFAATAEAAARGLRKADFSTTAAGGRCNACDGLGQIRISMDFLPDVWVTCEDCGGTRYGEPVLACRLDGRHIADALEMTVDDARAFFGGSLTVRGSDAAEARLAAQLDALQKVGLGYVRLGQPVRTLSGGERQRLALSAALDAGRGDPGLYLFDEPTRGLHPEDVDRLHSVFDGLIAAGHTLVVVEHNLDVIRHADWVIDLGPEGGDAGGRIVAVGPPAAIEACETSHTGRALRGERVRPTSPGACN
jgi:excinuclease ABC subunit A